MQKSTNAEEIPSLYSKIWQSEMKKQPASRGYRVRLKIPDGSANPFIVQLLISYYRLKNDWRM
jgi:hypothetical protein